MTTWMSHHLTSWFRNRSIASTLALEACRKSRLSTDRLYLRCKSMSSFKRIDSLPSVSYWRDLGYLLMIRMARKRIQKRTWVISPSIERWQSPIQLMSCRIFSSTRIHCFIKSYRLSLRFKCYTTSTRITPVRFYEMIKVTIQKTI